MKKIYCIILLSIFALSVRESFSQELISQEITSADDNSQIHNVAKPLISQTFTMEFNFSNSAITFKGIMIKTISPNVFWVRNSRVITSENKVLIDMNKKVLVNGFPFISQISADNGYIVEFPAENSANKNIIITIAGANGEKISDDLIINLDDIN